MRSRRSTAPSTRCAQCGGSWGSTRNWSFIGRGESAGPLGGGRQCDSRLRGVRRRDRGRPDGDLSRRRSCCSGYWSCASTGRCGSPTSWRSGSRAGRWLTSPGGSSESRATGSCTTQCWPRGLRYDNVVHFCGFGVAGIATWEALAPRLMRRDPPALAAGIVVWLFGMGIGALNEVVEFAIALNVEDSNVGGYLNTGRDLVANMLGAAVAGMVVARPVRSAAADAAGFPLGHRAQEKNGHDRHAAGGHQATEGGRRDRRGCRSRRCSRCRPGRSRWPLPTGPPPPQPRRRRTARPGWRRTGALGILRRAIGTAVPHRMVRRGRTATRMSDHGSSLEGT